MKYIIIYLLYLNLILVNCININCTPSQIEPIYKIINNNSDCNNNNNNNNEILSPIIYIENYYNYNNIICTPSPDLTTIENGYYYLYLNYNVNYTITFVNSICGKVESVNKSINIITKEGPRLVISQPKCLNSYAVINYISGDNINNSGNEREYYIGDEKVELPHELKFNSLDSISFYTKLNNSIECRSNIFLYQDNNSNSEELEPVINIIPAKCNQGGKIIVENHQKYTSVKLLDSVNNNKAIELSGSSSFENLNQGLYSIILESVNCGKQSLEISIENTPPSYQMLIVNDTCPNRPSYLISFDQDLYKFQLVKNSTILNNPFEYDDQPIYINIENCGSFKIPPISSPSSFPSINYSTAFNLDNYCQKNYNITFNFGSASDNFKIEYYNINNNRDTGLIKLDQNNSFMADINYQYEVKSPKCYSNSYIIYPPTPIPVYNISSKTNYCNELINITILNWEKFSNIYIIPSYSSDYDNYDSQIHSVNGLFMQVPNQEYLLYYNYNNCSIIEERYITIGTNNQDSNVYSTIKVLTEPTCVNNNLFNGVVEVSIFDGFTNNEITKVNETLTYFNDFSNQFIINLLPKFSCNTNVNFNYTRKTPDFKITTLYRPICKYSNENATISITSPSDIGSIYINSIKQTMNNNLQVPIGNNSIRIDFTSNGIVCNSIETYYYAESQYPNFKVEYDTTPINDCASNLGGFSIKNYNNYTTVSVNGNYSILNSNGNSDNIYSSGIINFDFSVELDQDKVCSGTENIYIPTSLQIDSAPYQIIQEPLCDDDNSGAITFTGTIKLKDDDKLYSIDKVEGNEINSMSVGTYRFLVYSSHCSWNIPVEIKSSNVQINSILESNYFQKCADNYRYKLNFSNEFAEKSSIITSSSISYQNNGYNYIIGDTLSNGKPIKVDIKFGSNLACHKSLIIQPQQTSISDIKYNILYENSGECSSVDIQVENYHEYNSLLYGNIAANSKGIFKNIIPGDYITASHIKYNCVVITKVVFELNEIIPVNKLQIITNETYYENFVNQILENNNSNNNNSNYFIQNLETSSFYPIKSKQDIKSIIYQSEPDDELSIIRSASNYNNQTTCIGFTNHKNQNIGLRIGLPIAVFCLVSLFVIGYIYKKKKSSINKGDFIKLTQFQDQEQFEDIDKSEF